MKQQAFVMTANNRAAEQAIKALLNRPRFELVGLGLIHGDRGLGKSRYGRMLSYRKGFVYMRLDASETPKSFSQKLWRGLKYRLSLTEEINDSDETPAPHGSTNALINKCITLLHDAPDTVIIIDEFDNALPDRRLRESVRDIADNTFATVILIGMHQVKEKLEQKNPHFFDRCNFFCEFKPITIEDAKAICKAVSEVPLSEKIIETAYQLSGGNMRKLIKAVEKFETRIKAQGQADKLSKSDLREIEAAGEAGSGQN